jgi:hypothetical protein
MLVLFKPDEPHGFVEGTGVLAASDMRGRDPTTFVPHSSSPIAAILPRTPLMANGWQKEIAKSIHPPRGCFDSSSESIDRIVAQL